MQLENGKFCPLIQGECKQLECVWFTRVAGQDPNTGNQVDEYACAVSWLPTLLIENAQQSRQTGAAVESFRNETVKNGSALLGMIANASLKQLPLE
tara:strand:- start:343 stop:630 length:288 start_codon:yes stop_codon:yes gene_type:complete